jgi:large conductance mechanosensitive channel
MLEEFKKFILRGNMVDLAVGVIIGGAFGKVVEKFAELITSTIGVMLAWLPFAEEMKKKSDSLAWGKIDFGPLVSQTLNLILVGFALFLFIKAYNRFLLKPRVEAPAPPSASEKLLAEIRDELKARSIAPSGTRAPDREKD